MAPAIVKAVVQAQEHAIHVAHGQRKQGDSQKNITGTVLRPGCEKEQC